MIPLAAILSIGEKVLDKVLYPTQKLKPKLKSVSWRWRSEANWPN
jgi:hypothetical protein